VEIFFVISGFVIPYALNRAGYNIKHYATFLLKRIVRLDPPYLAAIVLIITLGYLASMTPGFRGAPFHISALQLLLHIGYLNVLFGYPWLNPVFWTLAIEFQYYLFIGLLFPLIKSSDGRLRLIVFGALVGISFLLPSIWFMPHYLCLFLLGILTFQYKTSLINKGPYILVALLLGVAAYYSTGAVEAGAGLATAFAIAFIELKGAPLKFLGNISYSLYLLHVPIGGKVIDLSLRFVHTTGLKIVVLVVALGLTILAAYLLYIFVEKPAQRWSTAIRYRAREENAADDVYLAGQEPVL
jgi:peptidoglycan/LPS O-acetylase OafA/YrhL